MSLARSTAGKPRSSKPAVLLGALVLLFAVVAVSLELALSFDAPDEFWRQKGGLSGAELEQADGDSLYEAYHVVLTSDAGYRVRGYMRVPRAMRAFGRPSSSSAAPILGEWRRSSSRRTIRT